MLNRFRNAIYGSSSDDSTIGDYKDAVIGGQIRGTLSRSSSFRDELLSDVPKSRSNSSGSASSSDLAANLTSRRRSRSQLSRKSTISEEHENALSQQYSLTSSSSSANSQISANSLRKQNNNNNNNQKVAKFRYTRPDFLQLKTDDEIGVSADHQIRPIILPRDVSRLPWQSGYAECINAGKSLKNEDQAVCHQDVVVGLNSTSSDGIQSQLPFTIFGLFDGHAGNAVAVAVAAQLHIIISEKLRQVAELLISLEFGQEDAKNNSDDTDLDDEFEDCYTATPTSQQSGAASVQQLQDVRAAAAAAGSNNDDQDKNQLDNTTQQRQSTQQDITQSPFKHVDNDGQEPPSDTPPHQAASTNDNENLNGNLSLHSESSFMPSMMDICRNNITVESLVKGALESSFWEMDEIVGRDKENYRMPGGCAAIVSLFILGKLYVCNAGDSRAIVCKRNQVIPMSFDFTPTSERERILRLGQQRPELLGNDFTHLQFIRRPTRRDLGKRMLYRDAYMTGWSMKEVSYNDLKFPLVWGEGKRSRLCACIGLSRGFGDHELRAQYGSVLIKPFLTPEPEVRVLDLESDKELRREDVLLQASDGLWDVATNEEIAELVKSSLSIDNEVSRSKYRYISVAQDLVIHSRGSYTNSNSWRMADGRFASLDDICVFVVPLKKYRDEYLEWKRLRNEARQRRHSMSSSAAAAAARRASAAASEAPARPNQ